MVKCLPEFDYFYCILEKKRNFIPKIRISIVTDYAALKNLYSFNQLLQHLNDGDLFKGVAYLTKTIFHEALSDNIDIQIYIPLRFIDALHQVWNTNILK